MKRTDVKWIKQALLERLKVLLANLDPGRSGLSAGGSFPKPQERVQQELIAGLTEVWTHELYKIDWALERVREGNCGICEVCGCKIPLRRLQALPYAVRCVKCQREFEQELLAVAGADGHGWPNDFEDDCPGPDDPDD